MKTSVKIVIQVLLLALIAGVGYLLVDSIMKPIKFRVETQKRYDATKQRLMDIRIAQEAYESVYNQYTASFDTLIYFLKTDSFRVLKKEGMIPEKFIDSLKSKDKAEKLALERGLIKRDTIRVSVKDSLFAKRKHVIDSLRYAPRCEDKKIQLQARMIETSSKFMVPVFEARITFNELLHDLDQQLVINYNEEREAKTGFAGLKVGDISQASNNTGNWE